MLIVADDNDRFSRSEQEANADAATNHKPVATTIGPNTPGQFNRAMQNSSSVQKRSDRLGQAAGELNLWLSTARVMRLHSVGIKTTSACSDTATPGLGRDTHTQQRHVGLDASAGGQVPAG
ncbi:hypothetical protein [Xanthomonas oryzae]|uniref:hypothetical protein n=1 Tax=Xanthomonas oryzae TaxID=347 RepID=UPI0013EEDCF8|nr:hypothetical protein [Xanthomonas oryzae]